MLLRTLVDAADAVAATGSRKQKWELLAGVLRAMEPDEIVAGVGFLSGEPRQGRIGVGWSSMSKISVPHAPSPTLAILDLDAALDAVQVSTGAGSAATRAAILSDLLSRATEPEAAFVRRLMVGELRQGALEGVMLDAIAKASGVASTIVRRAFMLSGDLRATAARAMTGGEAALGEVGLTLMRPIQPMLASSADDVESALAITGRASVEWKLDGIRVQAHRDGDDVRLFTRNLNDVTGQLPGVVSLVRSMEPKRLLLDGEALAFDERERPHLFQETMGSVGRRVTPAPLSTVAYLFDCLHVDGRDLIDLPLSERAAALAEVAGPRAIPSVVTDDPAEAERFLQGSLDAGHEGVVVKSLDSTYQAGRRGKQWVKVKRALTLDLVVIGAEWGHGRRHGWLSNLHLGARDPNGGFVMVGKTFKGLTDATLEWQTKELLAREARREGITVFVRPDLVVEIELDGVQVSTRYPGGVALRFARVVRYRPDRSPADADTIDAVRALLAR